MFNSKKQLNPPPIAKEKDSQEILRVWSGINLPMEVVIEPFWADPGNWGITLVDIARHLAKSYVARGIKTTSEAILSEADVLARIRELFDAEWSNPTETPKQLQ